MMINHTDVKIELDAFARFAHVQLGKILVLALEIHVEEAPMTDGAV